MTVTGCFSPGFLLQAGGTKVSCSIAIGLCIQLLWVRWFGRDMSAPGGFRARRLYRIGFVNDEDPDAFGFIAPEQVIRGVHLIPAFHHGKTTEYLEPSIVRPPSDNDEDWVYYYVNM